MSRAAPTPLRVNFPETALQDLRERLARTRLPDEPPLAPWSTGTRVAYMRGLLDYWRTEFDWRAQEGRLNALQQFTAPIAGIEPRGGHFAALEQPEALAREIREFFRPLRSA
jgi:microsomal epoxide hydrolase